MKHEQHVRHMLVRCATDQLVSQQMTHVRAHVAVCADCRAALAHQEELVSELLQTALQVEEPASERVTEWWNVIQVQQWTRYPRHRHSAFVSLLAPVALSLLLLVGVLTIEVSSTQAAVSTTYGNPAIDTTLEPTSRAYPDSFDNSLRLDGTATPDAVVADLTIPTAPQSSTD